jgi:tetratricopeptide (TPR) repeat protein
MKSSQRKSLISFAVIILGFGLIFVLSRFLEANRPAVPEGYADEDLAIEAANLKNYTLGFEGLIADWYWMNALQYIGDKVLKSDGNVDMENLKPLNPRLLYPYLNNATELDPQFMSAYQYGAIVLPAIDNEQAIKLTKKGIENNPEAWQLYHYLGYIYWRMKDYESAAEIYERGAKIPGAPDFVRIMSARMKTEGGSRSLARQMYKQMYAESPDARTKESAAIRLYELDYLDQRDALNKILEEFRAKNNRCINNWREIMSALEKNQLPDNRSFRTDKSSNLLDPTGVPYRLNKENNRCGVEADWEKTTIPRS